MCRDNGTTILNHLVSFYQNDKKRRREEEEEPSKKRKEGVKDETMSESLPDQVVNTMETKAESSEPSSQAESTTPAMDTSETKTEPVKEVKV
jgi:hypothetical protein